MRHFEKKHTRDRTEARGFCRGKENPSTLAILAEIFDEDPATAFSHADPLDRRHSLGQ